MVGIQAVFFDQGNVLDNHKESDKALAQALDIPFEDFGRYAQPYVRALHLGLDELEYLNSICKDARKKPTTERIFRKIYDVKRPFNDEMLGINTQLRRLGFKTGIISNAEIPLRDLLAEKYAVTPPLFDTIICSCDVGFAKPDPEIYFLACNVLGIAPKDAVFIDDNAKNVQAFQKLGGY